METDTWNNCYPSNWSGKIVPDAIAHPAKFSSKLIRKIYEHMLAEGWVKPGDVVIDPFGGVALGAMDAMRVGLRWRGCELEEKFVELGNQNIEFWNEKFSALPRWSGDARLYQGDSRQLVRVLSEGGQASVSSPPYKTETEGQGLNVNRPATFRGVLKDGTLSMGESSGQLGAMPVRDDSFQASVSSPPFLQSEGGTPEPKEGGSIDKALYARHAAGNAAAKGYGESEANLGNMRGEQFGAAVSSPPYAESMERKGGIDPEKSEHIGGPHSQMNNSDTRYGSTPGQLGAMKAGEFDASVSSPLYEEGLGHGMKKVREIDVQKGLVSLAQSNYGGSDGNIGHQSGEDFWLAARAIVEQTYAALTPGGHAVWVVKDFVKNKQRVPFCDQWRQLCEAVGFVSLHEHRAMLVHHKGTQMTLTGEDVEIKTESKSFFRRLAEKKGSPRIDWESVLCMEKPTGM